MTETFASPADRIAAIESLPPEVRERLGLRQSSTGEWIMRAHGCEHSIGSNTYADDMSILAEMLIALLRKRISFLPNDDGKWDAVSDESLSLEESEKLPTGCDSIFSAALVALVAACKEVMQ